MRRGPTIRRLPSWLALWACAAPAVAATGQRLEEMIVVGVRPTEGTARSADEIAHHVQSLSGERLAELHSLDLTEVLSRQMASVSLNSAQGNPLQPDLQYRGYTASPLLGLPQGIAVYQDGARLNEPLGDAVNWDLLPESAVHRVTLVGGTDPLYGPNSLGAALVLEMKNGFNFQHHQAELTAGSDRRSVLTAASGGNNGTLGYYANVSRFDEDGWRDLSPSTAETAYLSGSWRTGGSAVDLGVHWAQSDLTGNGTVPVGLLELDRSAIFTAPDITANRSVMLTLEARHDLNEGASLSGSAFHRENQTRSLNGDASEFAVCRLGTDDRLLEGLEEDDLAPLGLSFDDVCSTGNHPDAESLQQFLNGLAVADGFQVEDLTDHLSGTGRLSGAALNNHSRRDQQSRGFDVALELNGTLLGLGHRLVAGIRHYHGEADFDASVELAELDPVSRSTRGLGLGTFLDRESTAVSTATESWSLYLHEAVSLDERTTLTLAGRYDETRVSIRDRSGRHPEVAGEHDFSRFNPAVGLTWQASDQLNLYATFAQSSRAPTPIELTCNEAVFERARRRAAEAGEDPGDVDFECRLPNAFVADPPLDQVVVSSVEVGARGVTAGVRWHAGLFRQTNRDDIVFQTTGRATGLFGAIDRTRRQGTELTLQGDWQRFGWFLAYTHLEASFEDTFTVQSPEHPFADEEGRLPVRAGDRIPGIPGNQLKLSVDWSGGAGLAVGADLVHFGGVHLRGDEANLLSKSDAFTVVDLRLSYRLNRHVQVFGRINNLLNTKYENFGLVAEDPGEVIPALEDTPPLFVAPGPPRAGWVGVRLRL